MCGIFAVLKLKGNTSVDEKLFTDATNVLIHRGPDDFGCKIDQAEGFGLGQRRLSIIDLSSGHQPMSNEDGTVWITFNGELYNFRELKDVLTARGHIFRTKSDTEVVVHAYEEFGEECPKKFNGIFAFVIFDYKNRKLFVARDHFGVKPLYYSISNDEIVIASEMKAILHYTGVRPPLNPFALALSLNFRYIPSPYTLFEGISKLPAGSVLSAQRGGAHKVTRYVDNVPHIDTSKNETEWIELLSEKLEKAVERQLIADVPVGISLSGGIDSGLLLCLMNKFKGNGLHAFTVSFEGQKKDLDEGPRAFANANRFGAIFHHRVVGSEEYRDFLHQFLWFLEEPISNDAAVAYYFIAEMAKGTVKVLLNGQGVDELFAGYDRYAALYYSEKYGAMFRFLMNHAPGSFSGADTNRKLRRFQEFSRHGDAAIRIASISSIITSDERGKLFGDELAQYAAGNAMEKEAAKLIPVGGGLNTAEKAMYYDMYSSLSENLLLCEDKMAMAASIEARVPYLDPDFAFAALNVPSRFKIRNGTGKSIFKKIARKYVPDEIVYQKKIGFNNPVGDWLKESLGNELLDYVHSKDSISNRYLKTQYIDQIFNEHKTGKQNHEFLLFSLYCLEKWADTFLNHSI